MVSYYFAKLQKSFAHMVTVVLTVFCKHSLLTDISQKGGRILSVEVPKEQIYAAKFKGISVCFSLLKVSVK